MAALIGCRQGPVARFVRQGGGMLPNGPSTESGDRPELTLVQGGGEAPPRAVQEAERWKGWTAVLLAMILVLLTSHMDGPVPPDPETTRDLLTAKTP